MQYWKWISRVIVGDFGESMEWRRPVTEVIGDRIWLTHPGRIAAHAASLPDGKIA